MLERLIKARNKKGFTLVELIVVLVIMAILAAIMVPALLGWIDKANEKSSAAEARSIYVSAQATATEYYGKGTTLTAGAIAGNVANTETNKFAFIADVNELSGITLGAADSITLGGSGTHAGYVVTSITYDGQTYTFS